MRAGLIIDLPVALEEFGAVRIYEVAKVLELDSTGFRGRARGVAYLSPSEAEEYSHRTAFVIPVKDEDMITLENVVAAVPHSSPVILVSASSREPVDKFMRERELLRRAHQATGRRVVAVHQRDPAWGEALRGTPLEPLLGEDGLVRKGKGEGMLLGVIAAAGLGADYVAFVDSDNYVPGAVHEYAWAYFTGFSLVQDGAHVMVRIKWPFKAKLETREVYLRKRGRVSQHTNNILNMAIGRVRKIETEVIQTANSGEHAMDIRLALGMKWAGAFAVESYQLVHLLEACWLGLHGGECPFLPGGVTIFQFETRNPHIHAERGDDHIVDMIAKSMSTIYYSRLADDKVKEAILGLLKSYGFDGEPPRHRVYPPPGEADASKVFSAYVAASDEALVMGF